MGKDNIFAFERNSYDIMFSSQLIMYMVIKRCTRKLDGTVWITWYVTKIVYCVL